MSSPPETDDPDAIGFRLLIALTGAIMGLGIGFVFFFAPGHAIMTAYAAPWLGPHLRLAAIACGFVGLLLGWIAARPRLSMIDDQVQRRMAARLSTAAPFPRRRRVTGGLTPCGPLTSIEQSLKDPNMETSTGTRWAIALGDEYAVKVVQDPQGGFATQKEAAEALIRHLEADFDNLAAALRYARGLLRVAQ